MKKLIGFAVAALIVAMTGAVDAQVAEKKALTLEGARQVVATAIGEARRLNAPGGAIAVVDDGGNLMVLERLDGTFAAGATISVGKARTAALFKKPTRTFEEIIRNGRTAMVALPDFTPLQGGIPLMVGEEVVGAIGVSGAATAAQDEEIAMAGAAAARTLTLAATGGALSRKVTVINSGMVAAGFEKGAVLVNTKAACPTRRSSSRTSCAARPSSTANPAGSGRATSSSCPPACRTCSRTSTVR